MTSKRNSRALRSGMPPVKVHERTVSRFSRPENRRLAIPARNRAVNPAYRACLAADEHAEWPPERASTRATRLRRRRLLISAPGPAQSLHHPILCDPGEHTFDDLWVPIPAIGQSMDELAGHP
jgi:hypothetical protein